MGRSSRRHVGATGLRSAAESFNCCGLSTLWEEGPVPHGRLRRSHQIHQCQPSWRPLGRPCGASGFATARYHGPLLGRYLVLADCFGPQSIDKLCGDRISTSINSSFHTLRIWFLSSWWFYFSWALKCTISLSCPRASLLRPFIWHYLSSVHLDAQQNLVLSR